MESNVSLEDKLTLLQQELRPIMRALGALAAPGDFTGDDLAELFALGIAAVIDHDTDLKTARDIREAAIRAGKLVEHRAKEFRKLSEKSGISVLDFLRSDIPISPERGAVN